METHFSPFQHSIYYSPSLSLPASVKKNKNSDVDDNDEGNGGAGDGGSGYDDKDDVSCDNGVCVITKRRKGTLLDTRGCYGGESLVNVYPLRYFCLS